MIARDVVGKKIVAVHQLRAWNEHDGSFDVYLLGIDLDDGSTLRFGVRDTVDRPEVVSYYPGRKVSASRDGCRCRVCCPGPRRKNGGNIGDLARNRPAGEYAAWVDKCLDDVLALRNRGVQ